jgi:sugar lactone lactonase YvrE
MSLTARSSKKTTQGVAVHDLGYCEGLCWRDDELWWSDFLSRRVFSLASDGSMTERAYIAGQPSGIGFLPDGSPLVVSMMDHLLLKLADAGHAAVHANASALSVGPSNDLVVDAKGRAYLGSFGFESSYEDASALKPSALLLVSPDGSVSRAAEGLLFPNGMAISRDARVLVVAETFANRLTAFDIGGDGSLARRRLFADLGARAPDGICMDVSGAVWAACPFAGEFIRVAEGGQILDVVEVPGRWAVTVSLGGRNRDTLFCATARTTLADFHRGRATAAIETLRVDVPGF